MYQKSRKRDGGRGWRVKQTTFSLEASDLFPDLTTGVLCLNLTRYHCCFVAKINQSNLGHPSMTQAVAHWFKPLKGRLNASDADARGPVVHQERLNMSSGSAKGYLVTWMWRKGCMTKQWCVMSWDKNVFSHMLLFISDCENELQCSFR